MGILHAAGSDKRNDCCGVIFLDEGFGDLGCYESVGAS
jgi:hypothetical protein